jgi:glycosyltransferase 2 family protein
MKKWILIALRLAVLVACIVFLIYNIDFNNLFNNILSKLPVWVLIVAILLSVFRLWLNGIRWKMMNTDYSYQLKNWDYFRYMMISSSFNLVMPGALGGDIVKAIWVGNDISSNKTRNILSVFFDRVVGMLSVLFLGLLAFLLSPFFSFNIKIIVWLTALILFILFILLVVYIKKGRFEYIIKKWKPRRNIFSKIRNILFIFNDSVVFYIKKPRIFLEAFLLSIVIHISWFAVNYLIAHFLDINISFFDISMISCLIWIITAIPISISGIGIREISYISLLHNYGVSADTATGLSLYVFSVSIIVGILGLPFVLSSKRKKNDLPSKKTELKTG